MLGFVVWGADNINAWVNAPMVFGTWVHMAATLDGGSAS